MTDMRKRLEKAVRDCTFLAGVDLSAGGVTIEDRIVNVILSALEEPSEAMLRAVEPRPSHWPKRGESPKHDAAVDTDRMCTKGKFVRMIKAAKGEE